MSRLYKFDPFVGAAHITSRLYCFIVRSAGLVAPEHVTVGAAEPLLQKKIISLVQTVFHVVEIDILQWLQFTVQTIVYYVLYKSFCVNINYTKTNNNN